MTWPLLQALLCVAVAHQVVTRSWALTGPWRRRRRAKRPPRLKHLDPRKELPPHKRSPFYWWR